MSKRLVNADDLHEKWMKERPGYAKAYAKLGSEYELASAIIAARAEAGLTQEQLAKRMATTRTAIARLESGRRLPSTRTLQRLAAATGHQLRITFERVRARSSKTPIRKMR